MPDKAVVSRDVLFREDVFPFKSSNSNADSEDEFLTDLNGSGDGFLTGMDASGDAVLTGQNGPGEFEMVMPGGNAPNLIEVLEELNAEEPEEPEEPQRRYPLRARRANVHLHGFVGTTTGDLSDPESLEEAYNRPDGHLWKEAVEAENAALDALKVFMFMDREEIPKDVKIIACDYILKAKRYPDGSLERRKARLVARGNQQRRSDYPDSLYAPVADMTSVRMLVATAALNRWKLVQQDIKNAFLLADLKDDVYVRLPDGRHAKLLKALNGLVQSPQVWNDSLDTKLGKFDLIASDADACLYAKRVNGKLELLMSVFVDDLLLTGEDGPLEEQRQWNIANLNCRDVTDNAFVGIEIEQGEGYIKLHQTGYIKQMLKEYGMESCKPTALPGDHDPRAEVSAAGIPLTGHDYPKIIGKIRWILTCERDM